MAAIGYKLSSEEFAPQALVGHAVRAEAVGLDFAMISDHFHPWVDRQGESPFVWATLGGIAGATRSLQVGTGVTCPTIRIHPAIIAQASATVAAMMPGRFFLGVGTGENLNEHVLGTKWPPTDVRQEMLEEAVQVIRLLWQGGLKDYRGRYYTVENARLYTLPAEPPSIMVAGSGPQASELAGRIGDGFITTDPDPGLLRTFRAAGGKGKPSFVELSICWAAKEAEARRLAHKQWALASLEGPLFTELPLPSHFESALAPVTEEQVAKAVVCGPDPHRVVAAIEDARRAGYDHICLHQIGPDQAGFFRFWEQEVKPRLGQRSRRAASRRPRDGRAPRRQAA
jgi:coenzyme F420-dependent glucose-6-phosphate dehydrogenase